MSRKLLTLIALLWIGLGAVAQDDPVLFTVEGRDVNLSEFKYIYDKTNANVPDKYHIDSLNNYLDLYVKFKLKVQRARELEMDKRQNLIRELAGYRRQLSNSYLVDKEVTGKLVKEAYDRSKTDVNISHILISLRQNSTAKQEEEALKKIKQIKAEVNAGNFETLAVKHSQDPSVKKNKGNVGYFTALQLPYELETVAYTLKENEISSPVRTRFGYHLVKVNGTRPAYGRVRIGQVLLRTKEGNEAVNARAESTIQKVKAELDGGADFKAMVKKYSEDNTSKPKGGVIGWIGINRYAPEFEAAAFGLEKGKYSEPFQTKSGWHILMALETIKNPTFEEAKTDLSNRIKKLPRFSLVQDALVERIKQEGNYKLNEKVYNDFSLGLTEDFYSYKWKSPELKNGEEVLFSLGDSKYKLIDFVKFAERSPSNRRKSGAVRTIKDALNNTLEAFVKRSALAYEESHLEEKYPDFKALMREYEEGILLFEVAKEEIWDKASSDEEGLSNFFDERKKNYRWKTRAKTSLYTLKSKDEKLIKKVRKLAKKNSADKLMSIVNEEDNLLIYQERTTEKGKNAKLDDLKWKAGTVGPAIKADGKTKFIKIEEVIPETLKTLAEARGYVVADYQKFLEKNWVKELEQKYSLKINEDVLKELSKKSK